MQVSVENATDTLGVRLKQELRSRYPAHTAKQVARVTGADLRTARSWVEEGKAPQEHHLRAIVRELGRDVLHALFSPEIETHNEKLLREIHDLREEANRLEARLSQGGVTAAQQMDQAPEAGTYSQDVNHDPHWPSHGPDRRILRRRKDDR
jgi:hypothetical protein